MVFLAFAENSVQLVPDGTIFLHIALILLMIWILNRTLFRPINRILEEREKKTGGRTGNAKGILHEAEAKLAAYERGLREARLESFGIVEQTRSEAMAQRQQQIEEVKAEIAELISSEKADLQAEVEKARTQLQADAKVLAERITRNVLKQAA